MNARGRRFAVLLALLLGIATPLAVAAAPSSAPAPQRYVVQSGDTISTIAIRLQVVGGWEALHAANEQVIGNDANRLEVGTTLTVPTGVAAPAKPVPPGGYVVRPGDTLSVIADRVDAPGGRDALYTTNRATIGPDPNRLSVGMILLPPPRSAARVPAPVTGPVPAAPPAAAPATLPAPAEVPATPVDAAPPASSDGSNDLVVAALLGAALVVGLLLVRDLVSQRDRRAEAQPVVVAPSSIEVDPTPVEDPSELEMLELMVVLQREPDDPFEIRLDAPEEPAHATRSNA